MTFALLTAICWAFGGFGSSRLARQFGVYAANSARLWIATGVLFLLAVTRESIQLDAGTRWFLLSGLLHFALGDAALFAVYRRLGPRLGVLMVATLAPAIALLTEWSLLGTRIPLPALLCAAGVVGSVAVAMAPRERQHLTPIEFRRGIAAGLIAALGQGLGAFSTRLGVLEAGAAGDPPGIWMATFLRAGGGAGGLLLWILFLKVQGGKPLRPCPDLLPDRKIEGHPVFWLLLSALLGPVVGVYFLMQALSRSPAGLVQAVLGLVPIFMIPLAWALDGASPSRRSLVAGVLAVMWTMALIVWTR